MPALEMVLGNVTAPGATTPALLTPYAAGGQSFTVRSYDPVDPSTGKPVRAHLVSAFGYTQANTGLLQVQSPRLQGVNQGIRMRFAFGTPQSLLPPGMGFEQPLQSQDNLVVKMLGSGVAGAIEEGVLGFYYEYLPGVNARFIDCNQLALRGDQIVGNETDITAGATGGYSGQAALNSTFDVLEAGVDYAILGATCDVDCAAIGIQGAETGNLIVAVPGLSTKPQYTSRFFVELSYLHGIPMIPVINGSNKNAIFVSVAQNDAAAAVNVTLIMQSLKVAS